jgi:hypothetical protein
MSDAWPVHTGYVSAQASDYKIINLVPFMIKIRSSS